jgi:SSS family solute:Na+ symporter
MLAPAFVVSPGLVQKLFGARDEHAVRVGLGLQAAALLAYAILPVLLGMAARVHFPELADPGSALVKLFTEVAPLWLGALMLAAILSAEVSSADAVLFMISTSLARDVLEPLYRGKLTDGSRLALARYSALGAGALSILLANWFQSILSALSFFYSLLTLTLFVPLLAGLFWSRPGQSVALAAIGSSLGAAGLAVLSGGAAQGWLPPVPAGIFAGAAVYAAHGLISWRASRL